MQKSHNQQKLMSLEIYRGLAAAMVVLFHYHFYVGEYFGRAPALSRIFEGGHAGVEFFFILSGFIIFATHRRDLGQASALPTFVRKRAVRILPMYWIVITLSLLALLWAGWAKSRSMTWANILCDYLLLPTDGPLLLAPAWTLKVEALFYAFFCLAILRPALGLGAFLAWNAAIVAVNGVVALQGGDLTGAYVNFFFDIHKLGFGLGILCAILCNSARPYGRRGSLVLLALGAAALLGMMTFEAVEDANFDDVQPFREKLFVCLGYLISYSLIIVASVRLERLAGLKFNKALVLLGASSYTIYLVHDPMASVLGKLAGRLKLASFANENAVYCAGAALAILAGVVAHLALERPLIRRLNRALGGGADAKAGPLERERAPSGAIAQEPTT